MRGNAPQVVEALWAAKEEPPAKLVGFSFCAGKDCYLLSLSYKNILDNYSKPRYYNYVNKRKSPLAVVVPLIVTNLSQQFQRLQKASRLREALDV